ncbi:unnamed protein product, partial [Lymnaea stagnalis]
GNNSIASFPFQEIFEDEPYVIFTQVFSILGAVMSVLGALGSLVAVRTFVSMGLKDGITVVFMFLAVCDFCYLNVIAVNSASLWFYATEKKHKYKMWYSVDPYGIYIFSANMGIMLYLLTVLNTTFLAVVRCLCVAMPIRFKHILNRRRTAVIIFLFCAVTVLSYLPILIHMRMVSACDAKINRTRSVLWTSSKRDEVKQAVWLSRDVVVTVATQVVILVCVAIMIRCLRASSRFRRNRLSGRQQASTLETSSTPPQSSTDAIGGNSDDTLPRNQSADSGKLAAKDVNVVRQVVLISVVYIVCNTPKLCVDITTMIVPEFTLGRSLQNLYLSIICAMELFQAFNSSINMLIYYNYNSKFK